MIKREARFMQHSQAAAEFDEGRACPGRRQEEEVQQAKARRVVDQAYGALKQRFCILYNITRIQPPKLQKVVKACVILYNVGIYLGSTEDSPCRPFAAVG
ncbi:unnamed protein product [Cylicocyclus nassatus]|uniref:DDE Tnp4 domain-containing protein n=1 Tax=Cylicocyclus nassatus TaxID=53992 RepID=A0AA36DSL2_CYLNA|nr:unnamed protein product [Cylicocyclus nassatus]